MTIPAEPLPPTRELLSLKQVEVLGIPYTLNLYSDSTRALSPVGWGPFLMDPGYCQDDCWRAMTAVFYHTTGRVISRSGYGATAQEALVSWCEALASDWSRYQMALVGQLAIYLEGHAFSYDTMQPMRWLIGMKADYLKALEVLKRHAC